jgi:cytochrome c oxidase subunit 2
MIKRTLAFLLPALVGLLLAGEALAAQPVPWQVGMQPAASPIMERIGSFHSLLLWIITLICLFVLGLLGYAAWRFRETRQEQPSRRSHNTLLEVVWTAVPVLILVIIAVPSFKLLYFADVIPETELTVKATGHQWYWSYAYPDKEGVEFVSTMIPDEDLKPGQPRLLATDNDVVVPVGTNVRLQVTAADVLHSWAMPSLGIKIDAVPGRLNEVWFRVEEPGMYYGQCSELCGVNHGFMPISIRAVPKEEYEGWVVAMQLRSGVTPTRLAASEARAAAPIDASTASSID